MHSSKTSRLCASAERWFGLSKDPTEAPEVESDSISRGTVPRPTPRTARPPERLCKMAKSSAKRSGCHCGTMLNSVPIRMRDVRAATKAPSRIPLGTVS